MTAEDGERTELRRGQSVWLAASHAAVRARPAGGSRTQLFRATPAPARTPPPEFPRGLCAFRVAPFSTITRLGDFGRFDNSIAKEKEP